MTRLRLLRPGDKVGLVAPGAKFNREKFELGIAHLKKMGLQPVYAPLLFAKDFIFAGTVNQRVQSLRIMLKRKDIKALWCVRGGCGSYAVAEQMAHDRKPTHPKIILGMSDITALHLLFMQKWKWPVLHGPLFDRIGVKESSEIERKVLQQTLFEKDYRLNITQGLRVFGKKGAAQGVLTGGSLTLLCASLGSSWEADTRGKILFIEEVGERAYRIDRLLTQLESAGKFDRVKGVILGDFTDCNEPDGRPLWKIVLQRHFEKSKIPCVLGLHSGHGDLRLTLPMGVKVRIQTKGKPRFEVLEGFGR